MSLLLQEYAKPCHTQLLTPAPLFPIRLNTDGAAPKSTAKSSTMVDAATMQKLDAGFQKLQAATDCKSLLKKYLTKEVYDSLKNKKTSFGSTLLDVIQSGEFCSRGFGGQGGVVSCDGVVSCGFW